MIKSRELEAGRNEKSRRLWDEEGMEKKKQMRKVADYEQGEE